MNTLRYKGFLARIDFDPDDQILVGRILGIRAIVGFHSETAAEIVMAFHEAVDGYLEMCELQSKEPERSYSGKFVVRMPTEIHEMVVAAAASEQKSINSWVVEKLEEAASH